MRFRLELLLVAVGCVCLFAAGVNVAAVRSFQATASRAFERELATPAPLEDVPAGGLLGRLEIPRLGLSVIVLEGDDGGTLARAVGHVSGTAFPWEQDNTVLAGHRDTFFQPLQHIRAGDAIRMTTTRGTFEYRVIRTAIVEPDDLSVLAPAPVRALTLVTCYPFVYVGLAPQRFIVHARQPERDPIDPLPGSPRIPG
jgi:LPXTG-site transpeptidase (sortase) family protein